MRIKMTFAYDGHNFQGFQKQSSGRSIQSEIEAVLSRLFDQTTLIFASGRTDIGVHALGQVAHFDMEKNFDLERLRFSMNRLLPNDIHINRLEVVSSDFHARTQAHHKTYRYLINMGEANPFFENYRYEIKRKLDVEKIKECLHLFLGEHRFHNFTIKEEDQQDFVRKIYNFDLRTEGDVLTFTITGSGFMRHMIRMMIGVLVAIGLGKETRDYIVNNLTAVRYPVNYKVPGCGLYLVEVNYGGDDNDTL